MQADRVYSSEPSFNTIIVQYTDKDPYDCYRLKGILMKQDVKAEGLNNAVGCVTGYRGVHSHVD